MSDAKIFLFLVSAFYGLGIIIPIVSAIRRRLGVAIEKKNNWPEDEGILPLRVQFSLLMAFIGSVLGFYQGCVVLAGKLNLQLLPEEIIKIFWLPGMPAFTWEIRFDALSAFFLVIISGFSAGVALYSFGALQAKHYQKQSSEVAVAFNAFTWATILVVLANDVFTFIVTLELMTLAFGYLSLFKYKLYHTTPSNLHGENKHREAWLAPQVYLIISHVSTVFLLLALIILSIHANSMRFEDFRDNSKMLPLVANTVFLLALAGLGIRAGLTPAHVWVSLVHPNSPTTTHALSLGIAIKVAIYAMLRFFFEFLDPTIWWGYLVLILGVITAVVNVRYALASHDLKKALAYHSIENIGIIVVGIGIALIFYHPYSSNPNTTWIAVMAILAALYHLLNHAVFKGLLYLCTGAIDNMTNQEVNIDRLGGILKWYPWTGVLFLIGSLSISGFPPLNGFISEWLTFQSALKGISALDGGFPSRIGIIIISLSLILLVASFAMTAVCFFKISGVLLFGEPRSNPANWQRRGADVPWSMRGIMLLFGVLCVVLGSIPLAVIKYLIRPVVEQLKFDADSVSLVIQSLALNPGTALGQQVSPSVPALPNILPILLTGGGVALLGYGLAYLFNRRNGAIHTKVVPNSWNCGTPMQSSLQVSSASLVDLVQDSFAVTSPRIVKPDYLPAEMTERVVERFRNFYNNVFNRLLRISEGMGVIQNGDIRKSLSYVLIMSILAMIIFLLYQVIVGSVR